MTPSGDLWIIASAERVQEVAGWLEKSVRDPRYIIHESGCAIAVGALCEDDAMLFGMMYPELARNMAAGALIENNPLLLRNMGRTSQPGDIVTVESSVRSALVTVECPKTHSYREYCFFPAS